MLTLKPFFKKKFHPEHDQKLRKSQKFLHFSDKQRPFTLRHSGADRQMDGQMDICTSRVAFATEKTNHQQQPW